MRRKDWRPRFQWVAALLIAAAVPYVMQYSLSVSFLPSFYKNLIIFVGVPLVGLFASLIPYRGWKDKAMKVRVAGMSGFSVAFAVRYFVLVCIFPVSLWGILDAAPLVGAILGLMALSYFHSPRVAQQQTQ